MKKIIIGLILISAFVFGQKNVHAQVMDKNIDKTVLSSGDTSENIKDEEEDENTLTPEDASPESDTSATITENTNGDNRQFITFETKSGKTFHLIIYNDLSTNNIKLLTEVSEQDLLNLVELPKEEVVTTLPEVKEVKQEENDKVPAEEKNGGSNYLFYIVLFIAIAGGAYYFKFIKTKDNDIFDNDDDDDFEEDVYNDTENELVDNDNCDLFEDLDDEQFE